MAKTCTAKDALDGNRVFGTKCLKEKKMQEVLFKIGIVVDVETHKEETERFLIIGLRQYNPHSGKSWDYVGVPYPDGYSMNCKTEQPYANNNFYFFNHIDIQKIIEPDEKVN